MKSWLQRQYLIFTLICAVFRRAYQVNANIQSKDTVNYLCMLVFRAKRIKELRKNRLLKQTKVLLGLIDALSKTHRKNGRDFKFKVK